MPLCPKRTGPLLRAWDPKRIVNGSVPLKNAELNHGYLALVKSESKNMFEQIISNLQKEAAPQLMSKLGLNSGQVDKSIMAAADSVKEVLGGDHGFGLSDITSLFSAGQKTSGADAILAKLGGVMQGKLTGQAGLESGLADQVKGMLLPMVTDFVTKQVAGDSNKLSGLLGGLTGGKANIGDAAKGLLGGLFGKK